MTTKFADYYISAVRFNPGHTHISKVRIHPDNGGSMGTMAEHNREDVVEALNKGITFISVIKTTSAWQTGQRVFVVNIGGQDYIKTVSNNKTVDNLDDLPEF